VTNCVLSCLCVDNVVKVSQQTNKALPSKRVPPVPEGELERLQGVITSLKEGIGKLIGKLAVLLSIVGESYTFVTARS
jgi:hypothetical protein